MQYAIIITQRLYIQQQKQLITQPSQGKTDTNLLENIHTHK